MAESVRAQCLHHSGALGRQTKLHSRNDFLSKQKARQSLNFPKCSEREMGPSPAPSLSPIGCPYLPTLPLLPQPLDRSEREGWARGCPTLLQSRWPSRQRQLLQSSVQELPCGKGTPRDQQGLLTTTTVVRRRRLDRGSEHWRKDLVHALTTTVTAGLPSWHLGPERPGGQLQRYPLISSTHVAP